MQILASAQYNITVGHAIGARAQRRLSRRGTTKYEMAKIIPLEDRVLIKPDEEKLMGDLIRPETAEKKRPSTGTVLAVGEKYKGKAKRGDRIFFQKFGAEELVVDKQTYYLASFEDVLAILKN